MEKWPTHEKWANRIHKMHKCRKPTADGLSERRRGREAVQTKGKKKKRGEERKSARERERCREKEMEIEGDREIDSWKM